MEELIFFAVIIFFSIVESIARSRKAKRGGGSEGSLPELPDPSEWVPEPPVLEVPSYDADDSGTTEGDERNRSLATVPFGRRTLAGRLADERGYPA